ncbi:MAG: thiamine phosphate synthase [Planctomycetes bacterium]|nr:thiamine phosphate synthase [Planctomycetota bacterium]
MTLLAERLRLVVVTPGRGDAAAVVRLAEGALCGGASAIWIRERSLAAPALCELARAVAAIARRAGGFVILSRDAEIAAREGLDAVHLGFRDQAPRAVRERGLPLVVGFSAHDPLDRQAIAAADYVTLSPLFPTPGKGRAAAALGLARFQQLRAAIPVPVVALGGVGAASAASALQAGADGVAVLRAVADAEDAAAAARAIRARLDEARA